MMHKHAAFSMVVASALAHAEQSPGDACTKNDTDVVYAEDGGALACRDGKVRVIALAPRIGDPCWGAAKDGPVVQGSTGKKVIWVVCRTINGRSQFQSWKTDTPNTKGA